MEKSAEKPEKVKKLEEMFEGNKQVKVSRGTVGNFYIDLKVSPKSKVSCAMFYPDDKLIDVLTIEGLRNELGEEGIQGKPGEELIRAYRDVLKRLKKNKYQVKENSSIGVQLYRIVT